MNIYVANFGFDLQDGDLKDYFTPYGAVVSAKVIMDKAIGRSRGFGFVEMSDESAGMKAIAELNGALVNGRPLRVNEAKPKSENFNGHGEGGFNNSRSYNQTRY